MSGYRIPKLYLKGISALSKKLDIPEEELKDTLCENYEEYKGKYKDAWDIAYRKLKVELIREYGSLRSPKELYTGFIIGDSGTRDIYEVMRNVIDHMPDDKRRLYKTPEGVYLDYREGKEFQPLEGKLLTRTLYGVCWKGRGMKGEPSFFAMHFWRDDTTVEYERLKMCCFRAGVDTSVNDADILHLRGSKVTKFRLIDDIDDGAKYDIVKSCKAPLFSVGELDEAYIMSNKGKSPVLIEGILLDTIFRQEGDNILTVDDIDVESAGENVLRVFLPKRIPINFPDNVKIIVLGILRPPKGDRQYYTMNGYGYITKFGEEIE